MCGIVGYIGHRVACGVVLEGLQRLEYRGYDSAGIATLEDGDFRIIRAKGKLSALKEKIAETSFAGHVGMGHTRWATHGKPDETNAHPHHSRDVILIHNGIIENYREIKKQLELKGHKIVSETDTEVICHLIQDYIDSGENFFSALKKTLAELKGAFALVILNRLNPNQIFAVRKGSPLVVGKTDTERFVASDVPALLPYTQEVTFLHDGEIVELTKDSHVFYDFSGNIIEKEFSKITWTLSQAEKSGYKHFMIKEIHEQPRVVSDTLIGYVDQTTLKTSFDKDCADLLENVCHNAQANITIIACGTSWHAGLVAKYWIEKSAKIPVSVELASEFRYRYPVIDSNTLVIAISQSGETADTLAAVREAQSRGAKALAICNAVSSTIARESDAAIYTLAGPEIGVASTKAFTTQLILLYLISLKLTEKRNLISETDLTKKIQDLIELPSIMKTYLHDHEKILPWVEKCYRHDHCYFLGRGIEFPVALEGALKLKEISYIHAEAFAGGEIKHGPIALIEEGIPVVVLALFDEVVEKMVSNIQEVKARGAKVFVVTDSTDDAVTSLSPDVIILPKGPLDLQPFLAILPLQLLAYHVADKKGTDVDQPRNLAKSVTVE